jgi:hypothetical protein
LIDIRTLYRTVTMWGLILSLLLSTVSSQWCSSEGCITGSGCECPTFWTYCNTNDSVQGRCDITTAGIFIIAAFTMLILFFIIIIICCCCCCCSNGLCRRQDSTNVHVHTHSQPFITTEAPMEANRSIQMV